MPAHYVRPVYERHSGNAQGAVRKIDTVVDIFLLGLIQFYKEGNISTLALLNKIPTKGRLIHDE